MRSNYRRLTVGSSTSTTSRPKSFIFGPVTEWSRSWSRLTRQHRFDLGREQPGERRQQVNRWKLPTFSKCRSYLLEGYALVYPGLVTGLSLRYRCFWKSGLWER